MKTASEIYTEAKRVCDKVLHEPCNSDVIQVARDMLQLEIAELHSNKP